MPYTLEELERQFKNAGRARKGRKKYANDADYWDGGRCEWGGGHSLREDCQALMGSFNKMENLGLIKEELKKCTSKSEYDAKKNNYIRKCEESLRGLGEKSASNSMFGICIIWSDEAMDKHVITKLNSFQKDLENLKSSLEKEDYKWVQELKQLKLEEAQINKRMEENKRKAANETDPVKKALLLQLIDDDGKKLKANLKKQQELSKKFTFNPEKKVNDLIEAMKKAIEKANKKKVPDGSGGAGRNRNPNPNNSDNGSDDNVNGSDDNGNNTNRNPKDQPNFFQTNQTLILISSIALLIFFFFYSPKKEAKPTYDYDF